MACYSPAYIFRTVNSITGDVTCKFVGHDQFDTFGVLKDKYSGGKTSGLGKYIGKETIGNYDIGNVHITQIPCGKCIGCRMDYSRSWADRLTYHNFTIPEGTSWYLTLTYDDLHVCDLPEGKRDGLYSLDYDHASDFIKKLRNKYRTEQIDYYLAGEYGDSLMRPHFHMILFNVPFYKLHFWKLNDNGDPLYVSDEIADLWKYGFHTIAPFSWLGAAYTASYVEKKRDGRKLHEYTDVGIEPEKSRCSRRPGIAHDYYFQNAVDLWNNDGLDVDRSINSSGKLGIPRYFRKLVQSPEALKNHPDHYQAFLDFEKRCIERANVLNPLKVENSSFDLDRVAQMLKFEEREFLSKETHKKL